MLNFIGTAFSPIMLAKGTVARIQEINRDEMQIGIETMFQCGVIKSVVAHENTAKILSKMFDNEIHFNRTSITLKANDVLFVCTPQFRVDESREFTDEEIKNSSFRFFKVDVE